MKFFGNKIILLEELTRSASEIEVRNSLLNDYLSEGSRGLVEWNFFTWYVQSLILRKLQFSREVKEEIAEKIIRLAVVSPTYLFLSIVGWEEEGSCAQTQSFEISWSRERIEKFSILSKNEKLTYENMERNTAKKIPFCYLWLNIEKNNLTKKNKIIFYEDIKFLLNIVNFMNKSF